jgi:hypothetical protein
MCVDKDPRGRHSSEWQGMNGRQRTDLRDSDVCRVRVYGPRPCPTFPSASQGARTRVAKSYEHAARAAQHPIECGWPAGLGEKRGGDVTRWPGRETSGVAGGARWAEAWQ